MQNYEPYDDTTQGYDAPLPYVPPASSEQATQPPTVEAASAYSYTTERPYDEVESVPYYAATMPQEANNPVSVAPAVHEQVATTTPPTKGRRALWWTLGTIAAVLVIALASFAVVTYLNRSTPMKTLDAFCNALQREDYQTAYNQLSTQLQGQIQEQVLAAALSQDKVISCVHGNASEGGSSSTTSLKLVHTSHGVNNDKVTLVKDKNSNWKIDNLQQA